MKKSYKSDATSKDSREVRAKKAAEVLYRLKMDAKRTAEQENKPPSKR